jgi:hypothetical protein
MSQKAAFLALLFALISFPVFADDWVVTRLRGAVEARADTGWQKLARGAVIPDDRYVRTGPNGRVELVRGNETISLEPNTQVRIDDRGGAKPFTTVKQDYGTVAVEAEVRQVAHFEVRNRMLAAVVKGTKFVVTAGKTEASVQVKRGHVYVEDNSNKSNVTLSVGQQASLSTGSVLNVEGRGTLPPVLDRKGAPLAASLPAAKAAAAVNAAQAALTKAIADGDKKAVKAATKALKDAEKAADKVSSGPSNSGDSIAHKGTQGPKEDKSGKDDKSSNDVNPGKGGSDSGSNAGGGNSGNGGDGNSSNGVGGGNSGGAGGGGNGGGGNGGGGNGDGGGGGDKKDKKEN